MYNGQVNRQIQYEITTVFLCLRFLPRPGPTTHEPARAPRSRGGAYRSTVQGRRPAAARVALLVPGPTTQLQEGILRSFRLYVIFRACPGNVVM